jgi:hypothetical protein
MSFSIWSRLLAVSSLTFFVSGCGKSTTTVEGVVTYLDKPLVDGAVTLIGPEGLTYQGQIQPDGKFVVDAVPAGNYKVSVVSVDRVRPNAKRGASKDKFQADVPLKEKRKKKDGSLPGWFPIPEKYSKFDESGLSITVGKEPVHFDIPWTD